MTIRHVPMAASGATQADRGAGRGRHALLGYLVGQDMDAATSILSALRADGFHGIRVADLDHVLADSAADASFAIITFETAAQFGDAMERVTMGRESLRVLAHLPVPSFDYGCQAFRLGAFDVFAAPIEPLDVSRAMRRLRNTIAEEEGGGADVARLDVVEKAAIVDALRRCSGQVSLTARKLGIGRSTLYRKLEQYEIPNPRH